MLFHTNTTISLIISSIAATNTTSTIENELLIEEIKRGAPIERVDPKYPIQAARTGQEGWVIVSYVIGKDGKVNSAIVEESSNKSMFNKSTLNAVNSWKFEPTTVNGKAVEQCKNSVRIDYKLTNAENGARRKFVSQYKRILTMIDEKSFEDADNAINKLKKRGAWNLYEDAWLSSLEVQYYNKKGDELGEMEVLNRLSYGNDNYLDLNTTLNHMIRLFKLNLKNKLYVDALRLAKLIEKTDTKSVVYPSMIKTVGQIETFIDTGGHYSVQGTIKDGVWRYDIARGSFAFDGVTDHLRKLDIRCDNKFVSYRIKEQSTWTIPKSYGECALYVYGEENTIVNLIEVKNS
ncbi:MAG: hypothetical protein BM565_00085 [Gammaproteobacteria bacterium MedPE]|nr:MAG: hypothetical protein BM565_00085 [Gammaproteobacteria bacterium MedPE]